MPMDRSTGEDQPHERADRPDRLVDKVRRAANAEERWERSQGYDASTFRDNRPVDSGNPNSPSRERILWYRYYDAYERAEASSQPDEGDSTPDTDERDEGVRLPREVVETADDNLPDVPNPRENADRTYPTTAHIFGEHGFLREDASGGRNPDGTRDGRVDEAKQMMIDDLEWPGLGRYRTETHVETKTVVDMVEGRLPSKVAMVLNNVPCEGLASCREFFDRLPDGYSVRVYDYNGNEELFQGTYRGSR